MSRVDESRGLVTSPKSDSHWDSLRFSFGIIEKRESLSIQDVIVEVRIEQHSQSGVYRWQQEDQWRSLYSIDDSKQRSQENDKRTNAIVLTIMACHNITGVFLPICSFPFPLCSSILSHSLHCLLCYSHEIIFVSF